MALDTREFDRQFELKQKHAEGYADACEWIVLLVQRMQPMNDDDRATFLKGNIARTRGAGFPSYDWPQIKVMEAMLDH